MTDYSASSQALMPFAVGSVLPLKSSSSVVELKREGRLDESPQNDSASVKLDQDLQTRIVIIDENALSRSCLMRCLAASEGNFVAEGHPRIADWEAAGPTMTMPIVLLCATGRKATETSIRRDLDLVIQAAPDARIILVSDYEEPTEIVAALERGAKGYIAMSSNLDVAIAAIRLVRAGGTFVPASGLLSSRSQGAQASEESEVGGRSRQTVFTQRQLEVIDRLRQGESNKLIAYKLNMGECTVKVHVRNIMRKIKARNRTEIAFLTNELF
ncbi:response regulator transcription factor [Labrys sp. KNU-23]|uniref:response regulator transcription factor n=1 Tax=Labrys sp. KNU-23 TaxID=2789216 RepID=UPI0011F0609C|nr:response regulator transcription factor [Labrys sp. KNU-23]QEN86962.1 response regulator transcription factor [Labrys sp. KNU-23]